LWPCGDQDTDIDFFLAGEDTISHVPCYLWSIKLVVLQSIDNFEVLKKSGELSIDRFQLGAEFSMNQAELGPLKSELCNRGGHIVNWRVSLLQLGRNAGSFFPLQF